MISRRNFLIGSAGAGMITAAVGVGHLGGYPDPTISLRNLSAREAHIFQVIGRWMVPPTDGLPGHGGDHITLGHIDEMLAEVPEGMRTLLSGLPLAFEHGPLLLKWGSRRMTELSETELDEYLTEWSQSTLTPMCQLMAALKTLYGFAYYERSDVLEAIRIPGVCTAMASIE